MSDLRAHLLAREGRLRRFDWIVGTVGLNVIRGVADELPSPFGLLVGALLLYPQICLDAKRLHDLGVSARWQTPAVLVSVALLYFGGFAGLGRAADAWLAGSPDAARAILALVFFGGLLAYWAVLAFAPGRAEPNRYGPSPRGLPAGPSARAPGAG